MSTRTRRELPAPHNDGDVTTYEADDNGEDKHQGSAWRGNYSWRRRDDRPITPHAYLLRLALDDDASTEEAIVREEC